MVRWLVSLCANGESVCGGGGWGVRAMLPTSDNKLKACMGLRCLNQQHFCAPETRSLAQHWLHAPRRSALKLESCHSAAAKSQVTRLRARIFRFLPSHLSRLSYVKCLAAPLKQLRQSAGIAGPGSSCCKRLAAGTAGEQGLHTLVFTKGHCTRRLLKCLCG